MKNIILHFHYNPITIQKYWHFVDLAETYPKRELLKRKYHCDSEDCNNCKSECDKILRNTEIMVVATSIAGVSIVILILLKLEFWILRRGMITPLNEMTSLDSLICESIFFVLILLNLCGLRSSWVPYTCWPVMMLLLSFATWGASTLQWVTCNWQRHLAHTTPSNLQLAGRIPLALIEILSRIIRPLTLGIRLCANILGGHLITELASSIGAIMIISAYESFVCMMQGLIFSLLLTRYFEEQCRSCYSIHSKVSEDRLNIA